VPQTVQITIAFNIVAPAPPPLVATPTSATDDLTVGTPAPTTPVAVVSGGTLPYQAPTVDASSPAQLPPGLTAAIDASGNVTIQGTPTTPGSGTVILDVSDSGA
jgi:hypothetical protein